MAQAFVITSGTDVDETFTSFPASVSFSISDDAIALEDDERYSLTLIASDPSIIVERATTLIVIQDDDSTYNSIGYHVMYITIVGCIVPCHTYSSHPILCLCFLPSSSSSSSSPPPPPPYLPPIHDPPNNAPHKETIPSPTTHTKEWNYT